MAEAADELTRSATYNLGMAETPAQLPGTFSFSPRLPSFTVAYAYIPRAQWRPRSLGFGLILIALMIVDSRASSSISNKSSAGSRFVSDRPHRRRGDVARPHEAVDRPRARARSLRALILLVGLAAVWFWLVTAFERIASSSLLWHVQRDLPAVMQDVERLDEWPTVAGTLPVLGDFTMIDPENPNVLRPQLGRGLRFRREDSSGQPTTDGSSTTPPTASIAGSSMCPTTANLPPSCERVSGAKLAT